MYYYNKIFKFQNVPKLKEGGDLRPQDGITYDEAEYENGTKVYGATVSHEGKSVYIPVGNFDKDEIKVKAEKVLQQLKDGTYNNGIELILPKGMLMAKGGSIRDFQYKIYAENTLTSEKGTVALVKAYGDVPHIISGLQKGVLTSPVKYGFTAIESKKGIHEKGGRIRDFKYEIYAENTLTSEKGTVALVKAYGDVPLIISGLQEGVLTSPIKYGFKAIESKKGIYENGGDVMNPPDSQGQEYGVGNFEFGKGGKVNGDKKIIAYYNELRYRVNFLDGEELYLAGNNSVSSDIEDSVPADEGVGLETMKKYAIKTGKEMAKERGAKFVGAEYEAIEDEDDYAKGGLLDSDYKEVVDSYLEAALWSSDNYATGEPIDAEYGIYDFTDNARKEITKVVKKFVDDNLETIKESGLDMSQVGHDLWLTRNRHGAGFWDRGLPKAIGDKLTENATALGECTLYVDEDGKVAVDGKYENGGMTDGVNANNINEEIRNSLPKDGEVKGVTEIIIENNGETLLYGTKTRKTQMSFKGSTVEEIKEEIKFTKDILARSKRDIETFDSEMASLQNSPTFTRKDREMAVKLHNGSILNVLHDEKIVIPYLEKLMEIKKRNKS